MGAALILIGVALVATGFALPAKAPEPLRGLVSLLAPVGGVAALLGVILLAVPDFLEPPPPPPLERSPLP